MLAEIGPEPQQGRDKITHEIASDTSSPTMTASSTDTDDSESSEGEYYTPQSHPSELVTIVSSTDSGRGSHLGSFAVFSNRAGSF